MAILQEANAVFYHPLDDPTEFLQTQAWFGDGTFPAGKVADAFGPVSDAIGGFGAEAEFNTSATNTVTGERSPVAILSATAFVVMYRRGVDGLAKVGTVSGTGVTFGVERAFVIIGASSIAVTALSATKVVVVYNDALNNGKAKVGTVSGNDITFGVETEFNSGASFWFSAATLSVTKLVVVYADAGDSSHGKAKVGTVSGPDITFGAAAEFFIAGSVSFNAAAALSATAFVVAYRAGTINGRARVGTVSGTDITFGVETEFATEANFIFVSALSATAIVVAFVDGAPSPVAHTAKVGTVTGTTITFGASTAFSGAGGDSSNDDISIATISPTRFVVAYRDPDLGHGTAKVGTVSGTDITFGARTEFLAATEASDSSVGVLSATQFVVAYKDLADSGHGTAKVGTLVPAPAALLWGPGLHSFGPESEFHTSQASIPEIAILSPTKFVVAYIDNTNVQFKANVGTVSGTDITFGPQRSLPGSIRGNNVAIGALSATQVAFAFANTTSGANVTIGTVSGTDITLGPAAQFLPPFGGGQGSARAFSIAVLSATSVVVSYGNESSSIGASVFVTISGLDVTFGAESQFAPVGPVASEILSSVGLSASTFVVAYKDTNDSDHGTAKVGTVVATTIVFGAESEFFTGTINFPSVAAFSATKIVVAYRDDLTGGRGAAKVGTVSGTTVTFGAEMEFSVAVGSYITVAILESTRFVVTYSPSAAGSSIVGEVSGTDISFSAEVQFLGTNTTWPVVAALSATAFVVAYRDNIDTNHGTAKVGAFAASPYPTVVGGEHITFASWSRSPNIIAPVTTTIPPTTTAP